MCVSSYEIPHPIYIYIYIYIGIPCIQVYLEKRRLYANAVKRAKNLHRKRVRERLEQEIDNPSSFWKSVRKAKLTGVNGQRNTDLVYDEFGDVKSGEEAVQVWSRHFQEVLNGERTTSSESTANGEEDGLDSDVPHIGEESLNILNADITKEEVDWALQHVRKEGTPGKDGISATMMCSVALNRVWTTLFNLCWKNGLVPSLWKKSIIIPVPKKRGRGPCVTDNFRGISLTSVVYKVLCTILNRRLSLIAEEDGLIVDEQGGFRKLRGCRDQILSLILLAQTRMSGRDNGMFATFVDFRKAYDRVNREKLWVCLKNAGVRGRMLEFLLTSYEDNYCEVKVGEMSGGGFLTSVGLRQGCVLSPLLFSLYISGMVVELRGQGRGVKCNGVVVPGLLFADDTALVSEDANSMRESLECMVRWCDEWGVEINTEKSGIMHLRKRTIERSNIRFAIGDREIPMVAEYKYLGCMIDEFLDLKSMVECRARMGRSALSMWMQRCRSSVGDLHIRTYRKLMAAMVDTVVMYGAEVWGCLGKLQIIEQLQMRGFRMFLGVSRYHPRTALGMEMDVLPLVWEARIRCMLFWYKIMCSPVYEGRLLKRIALEALGNGGGWIRKLRACARHFGWEDLSGESVEGITQSELKDMLRGIAWGSVTEEWGRDLQERPKLSILKSMCESGHRASCACVPNKVHRSILAKLRGGTAPFRIEVGRWRGIAREERICMHCSQGEVEDVYHWMMRCTAWTESRTRLMEEVNCMIDMPNLTDEEVAEFIMDRACTDYQLMKRLEGMWKERFEE